MRSSTVRKTAEFQALDAAYREAWARFLLQVGYWQSLEADANRDRVAVQKALYAVERAEADYRQSRNLLADCLLPNAVLSKELIQC